MANRATMAIVCDADGDDASSFHWERLLILLGGWQRGWAAGTGSKQLLERLPMLPGAPSEVQRGFLRTPVKFWLSSTPRAALAPRCRLWAAYFYLSRTARRLEPAAQQAPMRRSPLCLQRCLRCGGREVGEVEMELSTRSRALLFSLQVRSMQESSQSLRTSVALMMGLLLPLHASKIKLVPCDV